MKYLTPILLFLCVMFVILICKTISSITYFFSFYIHILAVGVMLLYAIFLYAIDRVLYAILRPKYIYFWIIELLIIIVIVMIKWWYKLNLIEWILVGL